MACNSCRKKRENVNNTKSAKGYDIMGGYGNLSERQIRARLENFKKSFCTTCESRYVCDYKMYLECKVRLR